MGSYLLLDSCIFSGVRCGGAGIDFILVEVSNKCFYVTHAAVTDLDRVLINCIMKKTLLFLKILVGTLPYQP